MHVYCSKQVITQNPLTITQQKDSHWKLKKLLKRDQGMTKSPVMTITSMDIKCLEESRSALKQHNSSYSPFT